MSSDWPPDPADDETRDDMRDLEALLAELDPADLQPTPVPESVWAGIEHELADEPADADRDADVVSLVGRRRRAWALLAAAAALLVVVPAMVAVLGRGGHSEVVSAATLTFDPEAFDPRGASARAVVELVDRDGRYEIRLVDAELPAVEGEDLQLWLIEPDAAGQPVDVAPVALLGTRDSYELPEGLDPGSHFVVDISIEPRDGDESHSGHSILRGALDVN